MLGRVYTLVSEYRSKREDAKLCEDSSGLLYCPDAVCGNMTTKAILYVAPKERSFVLNSPCPMNELK